MTNFDMEEYSSGRDGYLQFMERWLESWEEFRLEPQEVIDLGDRILVLVQRTGRGRLSGLELDQSCGDIYRLDGGRVVRYEDFWTREDALVAVGLQDAGALVRG